MEARIDMERITLVDANIYERAQDTARADHPGGHRRRRESPRGVMAARL